MAKGDMCQQHPAPPCSSDQLHLGDAHGQTAKFQNFSCTSSVCRVGCYVCSVTCCAAELTF